MRSKRRVSAMRMHTRLCTIGEWVSRGCCFCFCFLTSEVAPTGQLLTIDAAIRLQLLLSCSVMLETRREVKSALNVLQLNQLNHRTE